MLLRRSGTAIEIETPSKVNLFLEVLGRRSDGYHDLETIMMATSLSDRLRFAPREDSQICLHISRPDRSSNVWSGMSKPRGTVSESNSSQASVDSDLIPTDGGKYTISVPGARSPVVVEMVSIEITGDERLDSLASKLLDHGCQVQSELLAATFAQAEPSPAGGQ